jgi:lipopolysaccharide/colanic/teichoic acid biosynthesis glycosyltransferase
MERVQASRSITAQDFIRSLLDRSAALVLLLVFSPILLIVAILVKLTSRGPIFFRQDRVGRGNRIFRIVKFRTMLNNAEKLGPQVTSADDERMTRLGRVLRATKLDEYPQLWNVLVGDMSLVGPRPQVPRYVNQFDPDDRAIILSVLPGITGPTAIKFRHEERILEGRPNREQFYVDVLLPIKCKIDVEYVRTRSLLGDTVVLFQTLGIFVRGMAHRLLLRPLGKNFDHPVPNLQALLPNPDEQSVKTPSAVGATSFAVVKVPEPEHASEA